MTPSLTDILPRDNMSQSRLRFMHVPKAGGTTLNAILARQVHPRHTFTFSGSIEQDIARYRSLSHAARRSITLFAGHAALSSGIADADEATTITILRDPVSRVKSFCQHVSEGKSAYLINLYPPDRFDLDRFLLSGDGHLSNQQTKMLINDGDISDATLIDSLSPSEARDIALHNLFTRVSAFGLQERFDESVTLFARQLGWSIPWYFSKNTPTPGKRLVFEPRHLEQIRELNQIDIELYEAARIHFEEVLRESGVTTTSFSRANRALSPLMAAWDDFSLRALYWYRRLTGQL